MVLSTRVYTSQVIAISMRDTFSNQMYSELHSE